MFFFFVVVVLKKSRLMDEWIYSRYLSIEVVENERNGNMYVLVCSEVTHCKLLPIFSDSIISIN